MLTPSTLRTPSDIDGESSGGCAVTVDNLSAIPLVEEPMRASNKSTTTRRSGVLRAARVEQAHAVTARFWHIRFEAQR